jgi:hypothetical protein
MNTTSVRLPRRVAPGQAISAGEYNMLVDALGLLARRLDAAEDVAGAGGLGVRKGIIEGVTLAGGAPTPARLQDVTYTVRAVRGELRIEPDASVLLNRGARQPTVPIYPAATGDPCLLLRLPGADGDGVNKWHVILLTEKPFFAAC